MTRGVFVYALDDAYIHLSIARNLYLHRIWGVGSTGFNSASSSILWPILLAILGAGTKSGLIIPFILNVVLSLVAIYIANRLLPVTQLTSCGRFVALLLFAIVAPLGLLALTGMEHILQIVLSLCVAALGAKMINSNQSTIRERLLLFGLAFFLVATRYEGLFLIAPICGLLFLSRRFVLALILGLSAWLPVILFGLYSKAQGWYFFPVSVLLKTAISFEAGMRETRAFTDFPILHALYGTFLKFMQQLGATPSLIFMVGPILVFAWKRYRSGANWKDYDQVLTVILISTVILHLSLSSVDGPAYRYEAYLVSLGFIALVRQWVAVRGIDLKMDRFVFQPWRIALCFLFLAGPRSIVATFGMPFGPRGIFEQQYQIASFLERYYVGEAIAANDVGLINYVGSNRVLDLYGLTNLDVAELKRAGKFSTATIADLTEKSQAKLAVAYDHWFVQYGGLPKTWIKVAEWQGPFSLVCGSTRVSFFAIDSAEVPRLRENLEAYRKNLPTWIETEFY